MTTDKWRPMRSAPTDGTPFLCYGQSEDADEPAWAVCYLSITRSLCMAATGSLIDEEEQFTPTHWMPLPEAPL
jgi:hypothetical protein